MKNVLLFVGTLVVSLVVADGAMRLAGFTPREPRVNRFFVPGTETTWSVPDPEIGWINKEGVALAQEGEGLPMTFWSSGRRATRLDSALPTDGRPQVMLIGGSNLQSYGVRDAESFPWLLGERYPAMSFENFGSGGYSTVQAKLIAQRALESLYGPYKPSLILLAFDDAHMLRNVADQSWVYAITDTQGNYVAPPHYRMEGGKTVYHPFKTIGFWPFERHSAAITVLHNVWLQSVAYNSKAEALPVTRAVVADIAALAKSKGIAFAAVILDNRGGTALPVFEGQSFDWHDCSGPERTEPDFIIKGGSHPTAKMHAYLAGCIGDWLDAAILPKLPH